MPRTDVLKKMCEYLVMLVTKVTSEMIQSGMYCNNSSCMLQILVLLVTMVTLVTFENA